MDNKKGFVLGYTWIIGFLFLVVMFVLTVGFTDVVKVEIFEPFTVLIHDMTLDAVGGDNSSIYVLKQQEIHSMSDNFSLPWNFFLILITIITIFYSLYDVSKKPKEGFFSLLFGSIGGIIFMIYIIHLVIIGIIDYFEIQIIGKLFGDLIDTQIPFYNTIMDNWWFVFIWALGMQLFNKWFGQDTEEVF